MAIGKAQLNNTRALGSPFRLPNVRDRLHLGALRSSAPSMNIKTRVNPVVQVSIMSEPKDEPRELSADQIKERSARLVRRLGYLVFMGTGFAVFIPMIIAVASGIKNGEIWDPETGRVVAGGRQEMDCQGEARHMIEKAATLPKYSSHWDARYREWLLRCKTSNPEAYDMLRGSRQSFRDRQSDG